MNLDAYTLRKLAPKLLIAIIAVNISIYLCVAAIDITNVLGRGINQLISAPFNATAEGKFDLDAVKGGDDTLVFFGVIVAAGALLIISTAGQIVPMLFLILVPVILAAIGVLVTLVIRKALLVLLTIISPIAIALWILPGTEKFFKQWWSLFLKTLMVYPIIAAIFAVSNIMAVITLSSTADTKRIEGGFGDEAVDTIVGILLVFIPLFMVPFAFKFGGGALGALSGKMSEMQKPLNRIAGRARQKRLEKGFSNLKNEGLLKTRGQKDGSLRQRALWQATHGTNAAGAAIANLPGDRQGIKPRNIKERMRAAQFAHIQGLVKEDKDVNRLFPENDAAGAIIKARGSSAGDLTRGLHDYVAGNGHTTRAASQKALSKYFDGNPSDMRLNSMGQQVVDRAKEVHGKVGSWEGTQLLAGMAGSKSAPMWKDRHGEREDGSWGIQTDESTGLARTASHEQNMWAAEASQGRLTDRNSLIGDLKEANTAARRSDLNGSGSDKAEAIDRMADAMAGTGSMQTAAAAQATFEDSLLSHEGLATHVSSHPQAAGAVATLIDNRMEAAETRQGWSDDQVVNSGELAIVPDATAPGQQRQETPDEFRGRMEHEELKHYAEIAGGLQVVNTSSGGGKDAWAKLQSQTAGNGKTRQQNMEALEREHIAKEGETLNAEQLHHNQRAKTYRMMNKVYGAGSEAEAGRRAAEALEGQ